MMVSNQSSTYSMSHDRYTGGSIHRRRYCATAFRQSKHDRNIHLKLEGCADKVNAGALVTMIIMIVSFSSLSCVSAFLPLTSPPESAKASSLGCSRSRPRVVQEQDENLHHQRSRLRDHIWRTSRSRSSRSSTTTRLALSLASSQTEKSTPAAAATTVVNKGKQQNQKSSAELYAEADRIRNEAAAMELNLTISKIETIEGKLNNPAWLKRQGAEEQSLLRKQLEMLQKKLPHTTTSTTTKPAPPSPPPTVVRAKVAAQEEKDSATKSKGRSDASSSSSSLFFANKQQKIQNEQAVKNATFNVDTNDVDNDKKPASRSSSSSSSSITSSTSSPSGGVGGNTPYCGFDDEDLALYLPVALEIEALCQVQDEETLKIMASQNATTTPTTASNTTVANLTRLDDKLRLFRAAPELQSHFQAKITSLLMEPLQDMQNLQTFREQYLSSNSRVERQNLKRKIQALEKKMDSEGDSRIAYSDSIHVKTNPLSEDEIQERLTALRGLPYLLQGLYLKRTGAPVYEEQQVNDSNADSSLKGSNNVYIENENDIGDLRLAIELEHYETQIQLLEQIKLVLPLDDERKLEAITAVRSLPLSVRLHLAKKLNIDSNPNNGPLVDEDKITTLLIKALTGSDKEQNDDDGGGDEKWSSLLEFNTKSSLSGPTISYSIRMEQYNDVDFIDRSQYVEQLYSAIARLEGQQPSLEDVNQFMALFDNKKTFMVTSKPERVMGGYYIRGQNLIVNDTSSGTQLVQRLTSKLKENSTLSDQLDFFYIPDPSPLLDEEVEMEYEFKRPILVVTGKQDSLFYAAALPETKTAVSALGIASLLLFSVATVEMQPNLQERLEAALSLSGEQDLTWLMNTIAPVFLSMATIHLAHELAHRIVAWRDDFRVGWSTLIPSVQIGLFPSITPIRSPPPSMKSLFDFALAGPLIGLLTSLLFLISGLSISAALDASTVADLPDLPGLPVFILRSSALGGGLIEFFLGKGAVLNGPSDAVLPLHPFAIAGFSGLIMNALALIPFGNTDGGRVSTAMFGRSATYLTGSALAILLSIVGLFGADEARILLTYVLFSVIWQSELETPAWNEVEEVDLVRGFFGIATGLVVALILVPLSP